VSQISAEAVGDAQFVREALECAAIRRAAVLATEDDIRALEENLRSQDRANENDDVEAFYALDDALHQSLCDLSRHPTVWSISQRAKSHLNRVRRLSLGMPDYLASMIEEHRQVVAAFAARDPELAEVSLRYHLRQVLRELPRIREEHPEFFAEV